MLQGLGGLKAIGTYHMICGDVDDNQGAPLGLALEHALACDEAQCVLALLGMLEEDALLECRVLAVRI